MTGRESNQQPPRLALEDDAQPPEPEQSRPTYMSLNGARWKQLTWIIICEDAEFSNNSYYQGLI